MGQYIFMTTKLKNNVVIYGLYDKGMDWRNEDYII